MLAVKLQARMISGSLISHINKLADEVAEHDLHPLLLANTLLSKEVIPAAKNLVLFDPSKEDKKVKLNKTLLTRCQEHIEKLKQSHQKSNSPLEKQAHTFFASQKIKVLAEQSH